MLFVMVLHRIVAIRLGDQAILPGDHGLPLIRGAARPPYSGF